MAQATEPADATRRTQPPPLSLAHLPRPPRDGVQGLEHGRARQALVQPARPTASPKPGWRCASAAPFEVCMLAPTGDEALDPRHVRGGDAAQPAGDRHAGDRSGRPAAVQRLHRGRLRRRARRHDAWTWCRPMNSSIRRWPRRWWPAHREGWRTTLDKLEAEVMRMTGGSRDRDAFGGARQLPSGTPL